jgi:hypothetical protein
MSLKTFITILYAQVFLSCIVVGFSLLQFRKRSYDSKIIFLLFLLSVTSFLSLDLLHLEGKQVNLPHNLFRFFYFGAIAVIYITHFTGVFNKFIKISAALLLIFATCNLLFIQGMENNTYTFASSSFLITLYCVYYYYKLLVELPVLRLQSTPMFWYSAAFLIYNSSTLFLYLITPYLVDVLHNDMILYWSFHNMLEMVQQVIILIGLWQDLKNIRRDKKLLVAG